MDSLPTELPDEAALVQRALAQPDAFAALYDHYAPRLYTYMRYRVEDVATAEDLTAQTFEQALVKMTNYRAERAPFAAWVFGIAYHVVSRHYRAQNGHPLLSLDAAAHHSEDSLLPEYAVVESEMRQRLMRAIGQLSDRKRDLLALKFAGGLNHRQIADIAGLSESNVGVIVHRAIRQLRDMLEKEEREHE